MNMRFFLIVVSALLFAACENSTTPQNDQHQGQVTEERTTPQPQANDSRPLLHLQSGFSTSRMNGNTVASLFDNNPNTIWSTEPGSGPGEYIHLQFFSNRVNYLDAILVEPATGAGLGKLENCLLSVNDQPAVEIVPGQRFEIKENVRSLELTLWSTTALESTSRSSGRDKITLGRMSANLSLGLAELRLFGEQGQELHPELPEWILGNVAPTSTLSPLSAYNAGHLFDGRNDRAWVEGAPGPGKGETLVFELGEPRQISKILIRNGYQRSPEHFKANARLKSFTISVPAKPAQSFTLRDTEGDQFLEFSPPVSSAFFNLKIDEVYRGAKFDDMAISEIVFFDKDTAWTVRTGFDLTEKSNIRNAAIDSPLAPLLNRYVENFTEREDQSSRQSIVLRDDATFSIWTEENTPYDDSRSWRVEGNWQVLEQSPTEVSVKLSGVLMVAADPAQGGKPAEKTAFSENLKIRKGIIEGSGAVSKIYTE